jgi:hypothetical protein
MTIRCVFHVPGAEVSCEILRVGGSQPRLAPELRSKLARRFCESGTFISCPLFRRVERSLSEHHAASRSFARRSSVVPRRARAV